MRLFSLLTQFSDTPAPHQERASCVSGRFSVKIEGMRLNLRTIACALVALAATTGSAMAASPQPIKPVPAALYSGRWYEIARTPNMMQGDCWGSTNDFSGWAGGVFAVTQTCHHGSIQGPVAVTNAKGHVLPASDNAKISLGYMGGLVSKEFWIVDHADDNAWAIMATPSGHYVWLMSRSPALDPSVQAAAMARLQALGFNCSNLAYPQRQAG
jgi:apolipoprotein D and lipocalin family protein